MAGITQERLKELFNYDPKTGLFTRLVSVGNWGCHQKGTVLRGNCHGYVTVLIDGTRYPAHRLAWFYVYGEWPSLHIDHINGVHDDNRIVNLRQATVSQNLANQGICKTNTSGFKGVHFHKQTGKWRARMSVMNRSVHVGLFSTPEEAHTAYIAAAKAVWGEFARGG